MTKDETKVSLLHFTFHSLYFCATPVEQLGGERFITAVNRWYMPFIRQGWAVPLSFVIDVTTLLQRPGIGFKNRWKSHVRSEIRNLSEDYYRMLQFLRRQPIFTETVDLLQEKKDTPGYDAALYAFLRFLLAELAQFRGTYLFDTRRLRVLKARPTAMGINDLEIEWEGRHRQVNMRFVDPTRIREHNEFGTIRSLLSEIIDYYRDHRLEEFISSAERLMVNVAARTTLGLAKIDYHFVNLLIHNEDLAEVEQEEPQPRLVRKVVPTDSYEVDGNVGGYIDVNRRRFTGSLAEVLPTELATVGHGWLLYDKLLNEGALHFVREDVENIEKDLRLLFCFVVDVDDLMMHSPPDLHHSFGKGITPYVRARVVASLLMMDLARYLPRENVSVDAAVYLWSRDARRTYCQQFDFFEAWSRDLAGDRFAFAAKLAEQVPGMFGSRVPPKGSQRKVFQDKDPAQYVVNRSRVRMYHGRHMLFFTSDLSIRRAFPEIDPFLRTHELGGDSLTTVYCDVNRPTLGILRPRTFGEAAFKEGKVPGQLGEDQLREQIVRTVLLKAAGKRPRTDLYESLSELP